MLYYLIVASYVLICGLLIVTILLQQGKGGDIASAFGGGGGSQAVFGARAGATLLTRVTAVLAALFVTGALALAIIGTRGPSSVVGGIDGPEPVPAPPVNATPAPAATPMPPPGNSTP
jgi:preprotein translocase subunit SecG